MADVIMIGLDIAKNVFQAHGADAGGHQVFSRRIARGKVLDFSLSCRSALWRLRPAAGRIIGPAS